MSISTTIRNQIDATKTCRMANNNEDEYEDEYTRRNTHTRKELLEYLWVFLKIKRMPVNWASKYTKSKHKIRATKDEKPKITERYKLFVASLIYLFIIAFFPLLLYSFLGATEKKCYEFKEMKTLSCSGNCQPGTGFKTNKDRKNDKKKKKHKKVSTLFFLIKWKVLPACDLVLNRNGGGDDCGR